VNFGDSDIKAWPFRVSDLGLKVKSSDIFKWHDIYGSSYYMFMGGDTPIDHDIPAHGIRVI